MTDSRRHAARQHRGWARLAIAASSTATAAAAIAGVFALVFARLIVTPPRRPNNDIRILSVDRDSGLISFTVHANSVFDGKFGVWFGKDAGYLKVGEIVRLGARSVTRRIISIDEGAPIPGDHCRFSSWFYRDPAELGYAVEDVEIATEFGPAPAWRIDPAPQAVNDGGIPGSHWVIQVHGRGVDRRECIRAVPVFRDAGFTSLLVSYRNDGIAPASDDGRSSLGDTEWRDVDAALDYAVARGASRIILMGWSMGGAVVLQTITRSRHAEKVVGMVLDSPVVDWVTELEHQADLFRVPRFLRVIVFGALARPWGRLVTGQSAPIDFERLNFVSRARELTRPILLLHSTGDTYVPPTASAALAAARPDIVTFPAIDHAGHTRIWNRDSDAWTARIAEWIRSTSGVR
ncbi:alpha/beta hydrolase family protein [Salinibacterium hongtaonis]|uniref:alpha/beta hydrolase family protein n=1 Tax=Homoserinimonas hongtaonis TaxID=2079791 RepID=UPI000D3D0355|nr:alpha/beta fold hydrolase [Salinibacterium hongtaonis]AWB89315.1 alpha/beta hydrolase [Salinibacterium hongtaonis]